jgi:hypothetical protein
LTVRKLYSPEKLKAERGFYLFTYHGYVLSGFTLLSFRLPYGRNRRLCYYKETEWGEVKPSTEDSNGRVHVKCKGALLPRRDVTVDLMFKRKLGNYGEEIRFMSKSYREPIGSKGV